MSQNKFFFVALLIILSMVSADVAMSIPVSNSDNPHNLSSTATHGGPQAQSVAMGGTDQVCIFCHTPHSATPGTALWSRPDSDIMGSFPLYNTASGLVIRGNYAGSSGTQEISEYKNNGTVTYPNGSSRLCLSCHDGVTAMNILNDGTWIAMLGGTDTLLGTPAQIDLSTSHPISFIYSGAVKDAINSYRPGTTYQLPAEVVAPAPLDAENKMQCTTCHDPHEDTSGDVNFGSLPFWRHQGGATSYEDVCNECHIGSINSFDNTDHTAPAL